MALIVIVVMLVIAAFGGLTGSGLYAKERNSSRHNGMFVLLRRIAGVHDLLLGCMYCNKDDAPRSSDDMTRANIANVTEPCRCTMMMVLKISWMGRQL